MKFSVNDLKKAVKESFTMADCMRILKTDKNKTHYRTMWKYIKEHNIDTSHWLGRSYSKNKVGRPNKKIPLEDILIENSTYSGTSRLRKRLIKEGIFKNQCSECYIVDWMGKPISFHLDHINGINNDNRLENLRILCPNCHSQTETYCAKNKTSFVKRNRKKKQRLYTCIECKEKVASKNAKMCRKCYINSDKNKKIKWPSDEELIEMIKNSNRSRVSKKLNISLNALKKRLRSRGIEINI